MAHLLEHVTFMDSPARGIIARAGARTNAHTDFHHTVYFATSPSESHLPNVLEALSRVIGAPHISDSALSKEKAAVLSEMSMINDIDHRVDRAVFSALHRDNILPSRFPIGQKELIKSWTAADLREYHDSHYRPDNAILYLVGDIDANHVSKLVQSTFGGLVSKRKMSKRSPVNRHFPPVHHYWMSKTTGAQTSTGVGGVADPDHRAFRNISLFQHPLLNQLSFHILNKRPIVPIRSFADLKADVINRVVVQAAQLRLALRSRENAECSQIDIALNALPREGCAVCSVEFSANLDQWRYAVLHVINELKRMIIDGIDNIFS